MSHWAFRTFGLVRGLIRIVRNGLTSGFHPHKLRQTLYSITDSTKGMYCSIKVAHEARRPNSFHLNRQ